MLTLVPPAGHSWVDTFISGGVASDNILGDNIRPVRKVGESRTVDLLAGLVAGSVSRTVTAPAERVKTEMQLAVKSESMASIVRRVMSKDGVKGFFAGNLANCVKVAPQSSLFFMLTDYFKTTLPTRGDRSMANMHSFMSGTLAGVVSQLLIYPMEPIKTRMTVAAKGQYSGLVDCGRQIFQEGGARALYHGCLPTLAGCIPYAGVQRMSYDWLQQTYISTSKEHSPSPIAGLVCGLISSSLGMSVSYPLVVIRTRLQMQGKVPEYTGVYDCAQKIIAREGAKGLFKGMIPNLVKGAPAAAINFALYDYCKDSIGKFFPLKQ